MARGDFLCPVCGQILGLPTVAVLPGSDLDARSKEVGGHLHISVTGTFVCGNGHGWRFSGSVVGERTA